MTRSYGWAGLLLALCLVLTGCAAPLAQSPAGGAEAPKAAPKRIVVGQGGVSASLNQLFDSNTGKFTVAENLFNTKITGVDGNNQNVPGLTEAVPTVENGGWKVLSDGKMETRWTLRQGATWHDGTPLTTRDLLFLIETEQDRTLPQVIRKEFPYLDRMEAVDARTIVGYWKQPFIQADAFFNQVALPAHILEQPYREAHDTFLAHPYFTSEFVGTGPFKVKEYQPGVSLSLTAFDQYVLGRPKLDEIEVRFIPDLNTMIANVRAGAVDMTIDRGISADQAFALNESWTEGRVITAIAAGICMHPQFANPNPAVLSNLQFRKGLMHSINRQEMVDVLQHGLATVAEIPLEPTHPYYNQILAQVPRYPYDPRQATQLFQEAGYTRGTDGMLRDVAGLRLGPIEIRAGTTLDIQMKSMASVANYFRQAGMETTETPLPPSLQGDRPYRISYPAFELGRHCSPGETYLLSLDISSRVPTAANGYSSGNYPNYSNPQWDALQARFVTAISAPDRLKALTDLSVFVQSELFEFFLYNDTGAIAVSNRMAYGGTVIGQGYDAHLWELK